MEEVAFPVTKGALVDDSVDERPLEDSEADDSTLEEPLAPPTVLEGTDNGKLPVPVGRNEEVAFPVTNGTLDEILTPPVSDDDMADDGKLPVPVGKTEVVFPVTWGKLEVGPLAEFDDKGIEPVPVGPAEIVELVGVEYGAEDVRTPLERLTELGELPVGP
jgi:hypothetical protein